MQVCGEADNASDAISAISQLKPDGVITDISLPGMNGIEFLKNLKAQFPEIVAVVLSMHNESSYAQRALSAGAMGYVMKKEDIEEVIRALQTAFRGEYYVSTEVTGAIFHQALGITSGGKAASVSPEGILSDRELEVFELLGNGKSTKAIATQLRLSPKTVETHRAHIKDKLGFANSSEMIKHAALWVERECTGA
jgi:DNA-binding NarL/FixJ family response regulator